MNSNYNNPNNIHHNFPGIMNDGRLFTNYKNSSIIDKEMMEKQSFKSNQTYRKFLVDNANSIMNLNKQTYMSQNNVYYSNNEPLHIKYETTTTQ